MKIFFKVPVLALVLFIGNALADQPDHPNKPSTSEPSVQTDKSIIQDPGNDDLKAFEKVANKIINYQSSPFIQALSCSAFFGIIGLIWGLFFSYDDGEIDMDMREAFGFIFPGAAIGLTSYIPLKIFELWKNGSLERNVRIFLNNMRKTVKKQRRIKRTEKIA